MRLTILVLALGASCCGGECKQGASRACDAGTDCIAIQPCRGDGTWGPCRCVEGYPECWPLASRWCSEGELPAGCCLALSICDEAGLWGECVCERECSDAATDPGDEL
jgi:hypothetical protein